MGERKATSRFHHPDVVVGPPTGSWWSDRSPRENARSHSNLAHAPSKGHFFALWTSCNSRYNTTLTVADWSHIRIAQLLDLGFRNDIRVLEDRTFPANLHESPETSPPPMWVDSEARFQPLPHVGWIHLSAGRRCFLLPFSSISITLRASPSSSSNFALSRASKLHGEHADIKCRVPGIRVVSEGTK